MASLLLHPESDTSGSISTPYHDIIDVSHVFSATSAASARSPPWRLRGVIQVPKVGLLESAVGLKEELRRFGRKSVVRTMVPRCSKISKSSTMKNCEELSINLRPSLSLSLSLRGRTG